MNEEPTFEEKLQQLESIVSQLEKGERPLERALVDFQNGVSLVKDLQTTLKNAEDTLAKVMDDNDNLTDLELTND
ncbi:exodeoxyribonuclease VII small subunit [Leuconostoc carnosum]|uniref:Exodeoxyribonuclease 7 small subunit n=2 Tax=Leuconostoc carnosum TaxID=1252 RepID=K0DEG2_LEUCJ|nr:MULTISPECIES: exodeoxyribonuclease VII small subunit [Leuconostoc]AFT82037.1 exodeoxyribonuclease VII small subunit [Leuconostoc carnosum JB16]KAA8325578.1 exodeoxyribonuclease VII small subunit [Leuconostoc carnosum]KAA8328607.1 exodeoxyribonuclease VII small subunit [Leuconostoc carnosum]KAA8359800.1 exodeoxyribonuclease VII small subunit [Leuconostoc carnosum]KAA8365375.1 exodeoxyribonuclease VII small subunit [Leuconostoc carnosum]